MIDFKKEISDILSKHIQGLQIDEILEMIEIPPNPQMGDFAFPCFKLAKHFESSKSDCSRNSRIDTSAESF